MPGLGFAMRSITSCMAPYWQPHNTEFDQSYATLGIGLVGAFRIDWKNPRTIFDVRTMHEPHGVLSARAFASLLFVTLQGRGLGSLLGYLFLPTTDIAKHV